MRFNPCADAAWRALVVALTTGRVGRKRSNLTHEEFGTLMVSLLDGFR